MLFNFNLVLDNPEKFIYFISIIIVSLCSFFVFAAVLIDFTEYQARSQIKKEKKSIVQTGTMFLFFLFFYYLIRFNVGQLENNFLPIKVALIIIGLIILIFGCFVNIKGRLNLGKNWSNQIKIYTDQALITNGVYSLVRHPLYASIIWMFFGASLVYTNLYAFLANILIFIPFMYYRAKQEEDLLIKEFKDYKDYQLKVGMFFPRLFKK